jgi:hypothetical protein
MYVKRLIPHTAVGKQHLGRLAVRSHPEIGEDEIYGESQQYG